MIEDATIDHLLRALPGRYVALFGVLVVLASAGGGARAQSYTCSATLSAGSLTSSCNAQLTDASEHLEGTHLVRRYTVKGSCTVKGWQHCATYNDTEHYPHKEWNQEFNKVFLLDLATLTWDDHSHKARVVANSGPKEAYNVYLLGSKSGPSVDAEFECVWDPFVHSGVGCKPLSASPGVHKYSYFSDGNCPPGGEAVCPPFGGKVKQTDAEAMIKKNKEKYLVTQPNWDLANTVKTPVTASAAVPAKGVVGEFGDFAIGPPNQGALFGSDSTAIKFGVLMNANSYGAIEDKKLELRLQKLQGAQKVVAPDFSVAFLTGAGAGFASGEALLPLAELQPQGTWTAQVCFYKPSPFAAPLCTKEVMFHVGKSDLPSKFPLGETAAGSQAPAPSQAKLPAFGAGDPGLGRSAGAIGALSSGSPRVAGGGVPLSSSLPAVQAPVVRQGPPPVTRSTGGAGGLPSGDGVAARSASGLPSDAAQSPRAPGPTTAAAARTIDRAADLEIASLSLDANCNVWATLRNRGPAAIRETVSESLALDGRSVLTSSVALDLAPGQSQRRQVASYPRVKFADARVHYDVALTGANTRHSSIEESLTCAKEKRADDFPARTAPSRSALRRPGAE